MMADPMIGESAAGPSFFERGLAALPLLVPGLAGLAYLALFGAPNSYVLINAGALMAGSAWALFGWFPKSDMLERGGAIAVLLLLALTLRLGPEVEGITRWFTLGGFTLHVGLTVIPVLAVLSARDEELGPYLLLAALIIATFQPDAASTLALTGAAFGLALAEHDRRAAAIGGLGLFATAWASLRPNLAPQPFVERVIADLWPEAPVASILLGLSLLASVTLILRAPSASSAPNFSLAGALAGFIAAALLGDYPTPLIGYGAASIIGLGLALPAIRETKAAAS
ncbi:MAG: hypothetical protein AAFP79_08585 [Pseudomonadota bacterium]